ncbi:Hypothetical protein PHPALM_37860 [Phytophthora palmivora]|uniref:HTH CENPB-type domain-containing protein n=1 Tax=Phytophthora palmivora TaxID=4796 RepID=A0A2P4WWD2_9STRA|nr:Hypothetical protein PHPALM_37860 [Phytophthora palmivora]
MLDWINTAGEGILTRAVAHFRVQGWNLDPGTVRGWWRKREEIWVAKSHQMRLEVKTLGELEELLLESIGLRRLRKDKVTREWIGIQALQIYNEVDDSPVPSFQTSAHWVSNFMKRNDLSLRRRTNLTTLSDDQLVDRAVSYMKFLGEKKTHYNFAHTLLMDETAVYFEDAREQTVDIRGSRHVVVKSTGFASMRVTAVLAVAANGVKLPPLVIWKYKNGSRKIVKDPSPI